MVTIAEPQVSSALATPAPPPVPQPSVPPPFMATRGEGLVLPTGPISFEEYLEKYAAHFCEYVDGKVIPMSPIRVQHYDIATYLTLLFRIFFARRPIARLIGAPVLLRLPNLPLGREPDLQVVLTEHKDRIKETYVDGPCDICIEIVSPESVARDHGEKFAEYALGGVPEYWIIDPLRNEARFYHLDEHGIYIPQPINEDGNYRTPTLPNFVLHVPTLWQPNLPDVDPDDISVSVRAMLESETPKAE